MTASLPAGVLLAFYGDDFTGSTDAMEVTAFAGLRTILFTRTPDADDLARFADYPVIGIAGTARSRSPEWMDEHLRGPFRALAALSPRILQYKVCSTFDSSTNIGSIGRAIDIGDAIVDGAWSPSIVGAPQLGRWQVFANLFAAAGADRYRIDRHPTMSRHPVTPMKEADLRLHLAAQTDRSILSIDVAALANGTAMKAAAHARHQRGTVVFIDVADDATQAEAGRLVWEGGDGSVFSASSSGLQYALVAHWRRTGLLPATAESFPPMPPVDRLLVLSGSCSPVTAEQIDVAEANGFETIRLDVAKAIDPAAAPLEIERIQRAIDAALGRAAGVVVFAAKTIDDPAFAALRALATERCIPFSEAQDAIGRTLGLIAAEAVLRLGLRRLVVAGGDTAGRVLEASPVTALEIAYPLGKGAPVCRCHSRSPEFDGLEVVLKGGQLGEPSLFLDARGES
ncbi:four-carbon acid sugar kinase family protein [Aurantimonas sp. C2-6-R+9]|uniref:four-carbon acid sugar kinase family protein n=1 Tax=unclassified Aurantimonas TaxID=2638230 RepID=UPI002E16B790|nr:MULTISPECIES: four-carbon acid sugar kinase family protein [unclassified Aurantimonas]MEC5292487.1 four-carbon acid sugar kinase family protein [Aurantimonas sp. C2-3-R2]MEC5382688.1 four-carbon acid sugar kinase family protein [Aurantimonas sp. C2-6-R+9]MEC5413519.1 four-carbon acid sugar kinase family protein [Aurantimonas sp. C2-4-R8]